MVNSALAIRNGRELEQFNLGTVVINHTRYTVLTGYEVLEHRCFWCGGELKGKLKRYCRGHMKEYYRHFDWSYASHWALRRAEYKCENCGAGEVMNKKGWWDRARSSLEVHHIVPLNGAPRQFTAFNLPFNLIVLCHQCHQVVQAIMRGSGKQLSIYDKAQLSGQGILLEVS